MASQAINSEPVRNAVEGLRSKLLDLSLRNRMLNYRPSKRFSISVVGEDPVHLYGLVAGENPRKLTFVGRPDPPLRGAAPRDEWTFFDDEVSQYELKEEAEDELNAYLTDPTKPVDQLDTKLNTEEYVSVLQAKLKAIQHQAVLAREELGINTLFLTLGMLEWFDTGRTEPLRAPLLFIPVQLERQKNGSLRLAFEGSDPGGNLPLQAKLKEMNISLPDFDDEKGVKAYFDEIEATVRNRPNWRVLRNEVTLGFFSYEKFSMYVDLSGDQWPEGRKPWQHADVQSLLTVGYPEAESPIGNDAFVDDVRPVEGSLEVYDADQSQLIAMLRAASGLSMVVEGPPGTGKSQTITNMIAEAVAAGKRVLFVAAKRAAVDVVKRRLDEAGLGAMVLDMHDKLLNRKEFYTELKRTAETGLKVSDETARVERLAELRRRLNDYCRAMNEPLQPFGVSPFEAIGRLSALPRETSADRDGRIAFEELSQLSGAMVESAMPTVGLLKERLQKIGVPIKHPFWGCRIDYNDPMLDLDLQEALAQLIESLESAIANVAEVCGKLQIPTAETLTELKVLGECADRIKSAPPHAGVQLSLDLWERKKEDIEGVIALLEQRNEIRRQWGPQAVAGAWAADLEPLERAYQAHATKWYRFLIGDFRRAQKAVRELMAPGARLDAMQTLSFILAIREAQSAESQISDLSGTMAELFGVHWQGLNTDPGSLRQLMDWVLRIRNEARSGAIPEGLIAFLQGEGDSKAMVPEIASTVSLVRRAFDCYRKAAEMLKYPTDGCADEPWQAILSRAKGWHANLSRLPEMIAYQEARTRLDGQGLGAVAKLADRWPAASEKLEEAFLRSYYTGVFREAANQRLAIRAFDRTEHDRLIDEFQTLDDFKLKYNRAQVRKLHNAQMPNWSQAVGSLQLLRMQCGRQRGHKPIRWAMAQAGEAIQRIKPVFMMSPLTVALHLPPELPPFDLVIFDEASQIKPEDALCSIIRAKQAVVVGDTRQLPPTSFFDRIAGDEGDEEADDAEAMAGAEAKRLESLLELMNASANGAARRPSLRWHYRSIHPALIQPSNAMFYENRLVVFPSPSEEQDGKRIGVVFHHAPDTVYEPGSSKRYNRKEAEMVADAVLRHLKTSPELSLMVAAMNRSQANLIESEIEKRERLHPDLFAEFDKRHTFEPLRVRNLENVQGDERDVVFISVTYGRDASGVIRQQFGPLLKEGGERRLNVLITRARQRCEVFSNLCSGDLRVDGSSRGLEALKRYLAFAESGNLNGGGSAEAGAGSSLERIVADALREKGYETEIGVGCEGYRIDIAVRDPDGGERFILGIEFDGPTYHSARAARDRDKLRRRILEKRGWNLCRVWSRDWWHSPDGELHKIVELIEALKTDPHADEPAQDEDPAPTEPVVTTVERHVETKTEPYRRPIPGPPIQTDTGMLTYIANVVKTEGPIGHDLLCLRIRTAAGYARAGAGVRNWIEGLIQRALNAKIVQRRGDAYIVSENQLWVVRDWSGLPSEERRPAYVTIVEVGRAVESVVSASFGVGEEDAIREAFGLLGFKRLTDIARTRGREAVKLLLEAGRLERRDGILRLPAKGL